MDDEQLVTVQFNGTEVPYGKCSFETPRFAHKVPWPGMENERVLGAAGFALFMKGEGTAPDVVRGLNGAECKVRVLAGGSELVVRAHVAMTPRDGTWYAQAVMRNGQPAPVWHELEGA